MHALQVGRPYHPARQSWPQGADYNYQAAADGHGAHELRIFLAAPTAKEIEAMRNGPVEFGFFAEPEGLFIVTRFSSSLSFDCSYQWHRLEEADRVPPPPFEETSPALRALLTIILVDAATGIVRALRAVSYSPEFTRSLHRAIADQVAGPYDAAAHQAWAAGLLGFNTHQLWDWCTTRCHSGE
jgi:hypothetical protein